MFMKTYDGELIQTKIWIGWMWKQQIILDENKKDYFRSPSYLTIGK